MDCCYLQPKDEQSTNKHGMPAARRSSRPPQTIRDVGAIKGDADWPSLPHWPAGLRPTPASAQQSLT
ncbi:hypothetical protein BJX62DRAFT_169323 [Aspergillus germanicus]